MVDLRAADMRVIYRHPVRCGRCHESGPEITVEHVRSCYGLVEEARPGAGEVTTGQETNRVRIRQDDHLAVRSPTEIWRIRDYPDGTAIDRFLGARQCPICGQRFISVGQHPCLA